MCLDFGKHHIGSFKAAVHHTKGILGLVHLNPILPQFLQGRIQIFHFPCQLLKESRDLHIETKSDVLVIFFSGNLLLRSKKAKW